MCFAPQSRSGGRRSFPAFGFDRVWDLAEVVSGRARRWEKRIPVRVDCPHADRPVRHEHGRHKPVPGGMPLPDDDIRRLVGAGVPWLWDRTGRWWGPRGVRPWNDRDRASARGAGRGGGKKTWVAFAVAADECIPRSGRPARLAGQWRSRGGSAGDRSVPARCGGVRDVAVPWSLRQRTWRRTAVCEPLSRRSASRLRRTGSRRC